MFNMFNETIDYKPDSNEMTLRSMLWGHHGIVTGHYLYGDDGELNCNECGIDFKRHTVASIQDAICEQNLKRYADQQKDKS